MPSGPYPLPRPPPLPLPLGEGGRGVRSVPPASPTRTHPPAGRAGRAVEWHAVPVRSLAQGGGAAAGTDVVVTSREVCDARAAPPALDTARRPHAPRPRPRARARP